MSVINLSVHVDKHIAYLEAVLLANFPNRFHTDLHVKHLEKMESIWNDIVNMSPQDWSLIKPEGTGVRPGIRRSQLRGDDTVLQYTEAVYTERVSYSSDLQRRLDNLILHKVACDSLKNVLVPQLETVT
jgi:hypothetical protein